MSGERLELVAALVETDAKMMEAAWDKFDPYGMNGQMMFESGWEAAREFYCEIITELWHDDKMRDAMRGLFAGDRVHAAGQRLERRETTGVQRPQGV